MKVYLCGPINACSDSECMDWRSEARKHFPETIDPMRRDYRGREHDSFTDIVEGDKQDIKDCDVVLAFCPKQSVGTSMEIFFAWTLQKQVIAIVPEGISISPWLIYHCTHVVMTMGEAVKILNI